MIEDGSAAVRKDSGPPPVLSIEKFLEEWVPRSTYRNFSQVWTDPFTGRTVDFAQITDPEELVLESELAERQYIAGIEKRSRESGLSEAEFLRGLCQTELYYLAKNVLDYQDMVFHLHYFMCERVRELPEGFHGLYEFPRDTYKSTIIGISKTVQLILQDPNVTVLYLSSTLPNASRKLDEAKGHFITNRKLRELFPEHATHTKAEQGSGREWTTRAQTTYRGEASITAAGIKTRLASTHVDYIICDDIWDEKSVTKREMMAKTLRGFNGLEFLFRRTGPRVMLVVGTRYALDDLTKDIMSKSAFRGNCTIVSGILPNGRSLWPEGFALGWMRDYCTGKAARKGSDGSKYTFSCQIMLSPRRGDADFSRDWFRYGSWPGKKAELEEAGAKWKTWILVDAAVEGKDTSDPVALIAVNILHTGKVWVVDYVKDQMDASAFAGEMERMYDKWDPEHIVRQKTSLETTIMTFVNEYIQPERKKKDLPPLTFHNYSLRKREKKGRISASLQPRFQKGTIIFDRDLPHLDELEKELLDHPTSQEDDGIDALSMLDDPDVGWLPRWRPSTPPVTDPGPLTREGLAEARKQQARDGAKEAGRFADEGSSRKGIPGKVNLAA